MSSVLRVEHRYKLSTFGIILFILSKLLAKKKGWKYNGQIKIK